MESLSQEGGWRPQSPGTAEKRHEEWGAERPRFTTSDTSDTSDREPPGLSSHHASARPLSKVLPEHCPRAALWLRWSRKGSGPRLFPGPQTAGHITATQAGHLHLRASISTTNQGNNTARLLGGLTTGNTCRGTVPGTQEISGDCQAHWHLGKQDNMWLPESTGSRTKGCFWFSLKTDRTGSEAPRPADVGTLDAVFPGTCIALLTKCEAKHWHRGSGDREGRGEGCSGALPSSGLGSSWTPWVGWVEPHVPHCG